MITNYYIYLRDNKISVSSDDNGVLNFLKYRGENHQDYDETNFWYWFKEKIAYQNQKLSFVVITDQKDFSIPSEITLSEQNPIIENKNLQKFLKQASSGSFTLYFPKNNSQDVKKQIIDTKEKVFSHSFNNILKKETQELKNQWLNETGQKQNINFVLVGARATGKTVYLASLFLQSKFVTSRNSETTDYLKGLANILLKGEYPSATSASLHDLLFNYKNKDFNCKIQLNDVDGYFVETLSKKDKNTQRERDKFIDLLISSKGILFFFPHDKIIKDNAKEFNYQIDTVISVLRMKYNKKDWIPIPVTILVTKWDMSSNYEKEKEEEKALEYIENHKFLKLAKEKIEQNFNILKVIPISSTGSDITNLKPHNIEKPTDFLLAEIHYEWIAKLSKLKENREKQLIFLYEIYDDIKFYKNGEYAKLYTNLEKDYAKTILQRANNIRNIQDFKLFTEENEKLLNTLSVKNRDKIKKLELKFKQKRYLKAMRIIIFLGILSVFYYNYQRTKNESKLFKNITMEYTNHNYIKTLLFIEEYQSNYNSNMKHKNRVVEIKNLVKKEQSILEAHKILKDQSMRSIQNIDTVLSQFSKLGIKENVLTDNLMVIKDKFLFNAFNKKFNAKISKLVNSISNINNIDEYNNLVKKLVQIQGMQSDYLTNKIRYKAQLNTINISSINKLTKLKAKYSRALKNGVSGIIVSFGTNVTKNEPLGFNCSSEYQIEMNLNNYLYSYKNRMNCINMRMIWNPNNTLFKKSFYPVKIAELDIIDNDYYNNGFFILTSNDIIQLYNKKYLKKEIGSGYFIGLRKK